MKTRFIAILSLIPLMGIGAYAAASPEVFSGNGTDQTAAVEALLSKDGDYLFTGTVKTGAVNATARHVTIDFAENAVLEPAAKVDVLWNFTGADLTLKHFRVNGEGLAQTGLKLTGGLLHANDIEMKDLGYPDSPATGLVAGIWLKNVSSAHIGKAVFADFHSVGNGVYGDGLGEVRGMYVEKSGPVDIGTFKMSGGDGKEDNDYFHAQLGNRGGVIHHFIVRYNGYTRRVFKAQSGDWKLEEVDVRKGKDFVPDNSSTDAGTHNLNAIDYASSLPGSLAVESGYADCSGFAVCVADSGGGGKVITGAKLKLLGSMKKVIRDDAGTGGAQNKDSIGFYSPPNDTGSGMNGTTLFHFGRAAILQGSNSFAENVTFDDPASDAAEIGSSKPSSGQQFRNNTIITRTAGALSGGRVIRILNAEHVNAEDNKLVEQGNTNHAPKFIDCTSPYASVTALGNSVPPGTVPVALSCRARG